MMIVINFPDLQRLRRDRSVRGLERRRTGGENGRKRLMLNFVIVSLLVSDAKDNFNWRREPAEDGRSG